ncbi:MAG: dephospho-CoA kinase [Hyphomicrobiales bacterium]|nr:dephospho-CoA kinase [Hyphomicrobiales bacterium]
MQKLGLTGSIATGKSTVLKAFADLGVLTFSSDSAVHELYQSEAVAPVEALFPGVAKNGVIDREALGREVLASPEKLKLLEATVHPLVRARIARFLDEAEKGGAFLAVVDIPLLFEGGFDYGLDAVAVTICDEATQRQRALARPGMTVEKLDAILARQMPQAEKKRRASFVFDTSGPLPTTIRSVRALVEAFRRNPNGIQ